MKKLKKLTLTVALLAGSYLFLKYIIPLIWPFIVAYGLAVLIFPIVRFLRDKLHFHKNAAAAMTLVVALSGIVVGLLTLADSIVRQVMAFATKWPDYQEKCLEYVHNICGVMEHSLHMERGVVYDTVCAGIDRFATSWQEKIMPLLMNNSIQTLMMFMDVIILVALTTMAIFYMVRDMEKLRNIDKSNIFYKEITYMKGLVSRILRAYVKSQLIIMSVVAVICASGLAFIGNDYNIVLGIIIGISDALPLIGAGTVLIPWSIVYIFMGEYLKATVLFVIFIACYLSREFLEPKLMGQKIGMTPISTLISIYVGYKIFGFLGMIAGPLIFVMIREILQKVDDKM